MDKKSIISVVDLSFRYPSGVSPIFSNLSVEVYEGEFLVLVGGSGTGKTTLLKLFAGLESPTSGFAHNETQSRGGFVFQSAVLLDWLNVADNIVFPDTEVDKVRLEELLSSTELATARQKHPRELSGGMRSRVQLARSLYHSPKVLFLDEPFSSIDERLRIELNMLIKALKKRFQFTAVMATHAISEAVFMADKVWLLRHDGSEVVVEDIATYGRSYASAGTEAFDDPAFHAAVAALRTKMIGPVKGE